MPKYAKISPSAAKKYRDLTDRLSNMVEGGTLSAQDIPEDYQWIADTLAAIAGLDPDITHRF